MRLEELESARPIVIAAPERARAAAPPAAAARPLALGRRHLWLLAVIAAVAWSLWESGLFRRELVNEGGWSLVLRLASSILRPELSAEFLAVAWQATLATLAFAACGTALCLLIGSVGGILASEVWWESVFPPRGAGRSRLRTARGPWLAVRTLLTVPRAIHEIVWGVLLVAILGLDPLVAILAIAIPFGAITAKVFAELLDEAPRHSLGALRASGAPPLKAFLYSLVPEALPDLISYSFYRFECAIRSAAVLGIVGAGGLGYEILLSLRSLRYEQVWTLVFALIVLTGLSDLWSGLVRRKLGTGSRFDSTLKTRTIGDTPRYRVDPVIKGSILGVGLLTAFGFWYVGADVARLTGSRTAQLLGQLIAEAIPPTLGGMTLLEFLDVCGQTLAMSILAIGLAGIGGALLSFPAARNMLVPGGVVHPGGRRPAGRVAGVGAYLVSRAVLLFFRAVPAPIWALTFLFVFFPGMLPGALALAVYTLGVLGRLMAEATENLDTRPLTALRAQGAAGSHVFLYGVLPAVLPRYTAYVLYRWEVCIRATAMVGLVGAGGLGRLLTERVSSFDYAAVATVIIAYIAIAWLVDLVSAAVRRDLR